ncbi:phage tail tape measure protein [Comamonas terrigena]|uniref:phage tail tape measure protein n=1 Tax=Comamonas terrigena TaxID=32013 RepID=UPI00289E7428|nr:phage tail tape measure protein [Comamonas terrigena]
MADQNMRLRVVLDLVDKAMAPLKRIGQGSKETAATLKAAREQLKQLNTQQAALGNFQKQSQALQETSNQLKVLSQNLQALRASGVGTTAQIKASQQAVEKQTAKFKEQQATLLKLRSNLTSLGITSVSEAQKRMGADVAATTARIKAQTESLKRQGDQQRKLAQIQQQAAKGAAIGGGMAVAGAASIYAGKQVARPVSAAMGAFAPQENATTQLKASMMKADGSVPEEFEKINDLATKLGDRLPGTTADFIEMMTMLRRQGLSAQSILGGTGEAAALLGVQLQMPVTEAAEFAAKMQDATRTSEKDMQGLMDTIQRTYYLGVDKGNMLQGFSKMSPMLSIIRKEGLEASKMLAPLLVMTDQISMEGGSAGNAFRKIFQGAMNTDKIKKVTDGLKAEKGIDLKMNFTDGKGEFGGIDQMYAQLAKLNDLSTERRLEVMKDLFGDDSETITVLNLLISKGKAGYDEVVEKMGDQADLQTRVNEQLGTFTNVVEAAQGSATNALASIGKAMAPDLKDLVNWLGEASGNFNKWVQENQQLVRWLGMGALAVAAFLAATGALLIPLGLIVAKGMALRWMLAQIGVTSGPLTLLRGMFTWGAKLLPVLMRFGPVLLRFLGPIGLLITAGMLIYQNWDTIAAGGLRLWTGLVSALSTLWNGMVSMVQGIFAGGVSAWLQALLNFSPLGLLWSAITTALGALGIQVPQQFMSLGGFIVDGLIGGITNKLGALKDTVVGAATAVAGWFKEKLGIASPSKVFTEFGGWISEGAAVGMEKGQAAVRTAALAVAGAALVPVAQADGPIVGPDGPDGAGAMPMVSRGTPMAPSLSTAPAAGGGGNYNIVIHATPGMTPEDVARAVTAELDKRERAAGARRRSGLYDQS